MQALRLLLKTNSIQVLWAHGNFVEYFSGLFLEYNVGGIFLMIKALEGGLS